MKTAKIVVLFFLLVAAGCDTSDKDIEEIKAYEGPLQEGENVELYYSENSKITTKLIAQKWYQFENGNQEFPEGIYMEFFDEAGKITSTLRANEAKYFEDEKKWRGRGNVIIKNLEKNQELKTEELFWKPDTEKMFTEKQVRIQLDKEVLYGRGLEAKQDFSWYVIKHPEGEFYLDDE